MEQTITKHNKYVIKEKSVSEEPKCNCRNKINCQLNRNWQAKAIIYKATVKTLDGKEMDYFGLCETEFKKRCGHHKHDINNEISEHHTKLSEYMWILKKQE